MENLLAGVGSVIVALSFLPYLKDTIKKKIKPRIASWATWSLITGIATVVALSEGAYVSAALTGTATIVEMAVLLVALKSGDTTYQFIDGICQSVSIIGIAGWLLTDNHVWAVVFTILADLFAALPTLYHAWIAPYEEAWQSFIIFAFGSLLTVLAVEELDFINVAFPLYFTLIASFIGGFIMFRQKAVKA